MTHLRRLGSRGFAFPLVLLFLTGLGLVPSTARAASTTIVISQVYGGAGCGTVGCSTYKNDYIELYNMSGSAVSVNGWSVQYASATGTSWQVTALPNVSIQPGHYFLIGEGSGVNGVNPIPTPDATGGIAMSATAAKVALVNNTTALTCSTGCLPNASIVDFIGYGSTATSSETSPAPAPSTANADFRANGGCTDTDNNSTDFSAAAANPRNTSSTAHFCGGPTNPSGVGAADPSAVQPGGATLLTVTVTPGANPPSTGITVSANLASIGGSPTQPFFDDGTNGDVTAGDNVFSYQATVSAGTSTGNKTLAFSIADAQTRTGSGSISLSVFLALAIHDIQGPGDVSPYAGAVVQTTGIVTGRKTNGFFIQAEPGFVDADPSTSEGIFVFTSSAPPAGAAVGNNVRVTGTVQEFIPSADPNSPPATELIGPLSVSVLSTGNPLPAPIVLTAADTNPAGPIDQLEKYEGMRVQVNSLTVVGPTQGSITEQTATTVSNGVFYGVITGVARPFRERGVEVPDPLPPGSPANVPFFDANPERLRVDSDGLVGAAILNVSTGAVVTNLVGPLDYSFRTYTIDPDPAVTPGVSGGISAAIPVPVPAADQFTVASFNLERFFDTVDDPGISDVALTATAFANRLNKASLAIRNVLRTPDILGVEEMENLPTLQTLATKINNDAVAASQPNPNYQAYLVEGNDIGGIDVGFLVKGSRVNVIDVVQYGKDTTYINPNNGEPELLNDRPPLVLRATVNAPVGAAFPITVIVNHLRSFSGVDDPVDGPRVRAKREAQAEYLANLIQSRQAADPTEHIVSVGDYNAYEFSDGYVDSIGTIIGDPDPCDEVVLCSPDLVNPNLVELALSVPQAERYSYSFDGNGQVLDHELITQNLSSRFEGLTWARNDADFADVFRNDPNRPERISDHDPAVAYFRLPLISSLSPANVWVGLKNSDDVGIKFDLRAEIYYNGTTLIGSGELASVIGGSSGFNNAKLDSIPLNLPSAVGFGPGDTISIKLLVRNACSGSGKNSGTARLWFNDSQADSRFDVTADDADSDLYLLDGSALGTSAGPGPKKTVDVSAGAKCSAFKPFGTWTKSF